MSLSLRGNFPRAAVVMGRGYELNTKTLSSQESNSLTPCQTTTISPLTCTVSVRQDRVGGEEQAPAVRGVTPWQHSVLEALLYGKAGLWAFLGNGIQSGV